MAKVIFRAGKVVLAVIIPLLILGIVVFGMDVFSVAEAELQGVDSGIDPELQQMQDAAKTYTEDEQYDLVELSYYDIIASFPGTEDAMQAQSRLARYYIQKRDKTNAQVAIEKLLADYSDHPDIVKVIGRLADSCRSGKKDRAFSIMLYQHIVNTYPSHERAIEAQSRLAICYIRKNEDSKAKAAVEKLLTDYSGHPDIVECIISIVERYRKDKGDQGVPVVLCQYIVSNYPSHDLAVQAQYCIAKRYRKGKDDKAIGLYQYIVSEYPSHDLAVQSQSDLVRCYIGKKDKKTARAEVKKLLADYSDHPTFVKVIVDLADFCRDRRAHAIAIGLYQHILSEYPSHNLAVRAQAGLVKYYIKRKDGAETQAAIETFLTNAQAAIETLLTDYSDHPDIVKVISGLAKKCSTNNTDIAIELYQHIASEYPSHKSPMWVQPRLIKNYIDQKDYTNAQAVIDKLLVDYFDHPDIVKVIGGIADDCREEKADDIAIDLYQYILSEHPSHDLAIRSQSGLAKFCIQENEDSSAQAAVDKLLADYSGHPDIVKVIGDLAGDCRKKNVDRAIELYRYITNMYPSHDLAVQAHSDMAKCYIQKNDYAMALNCIDSVTRDYLGHMEIAWLLSAKADCYFNMGAESMVEEVVDETFQSRLSKKYIHRVLRGVAEKLRKIGQYERSLDLCQRVLDNNPGEFDRRLAHMDIAKSYIGLGDDAKVNETVNTIRADYGDGRFGWAILLIGEDYFEKGRKCEGSHYFSCVMETLNEEGVNDDAKEYYRKALEMWQPALPETITSVRSAHLYFFSAVGCSKLGQYELAISYLKKVVNEKPRYGFAWDAQYLIGLYYEELRNQKDIRGNVTMTNDEIEAEIISAYSNVLTEYPGTPDYKRALLRLGWEHFGRKDFQSAITTLERFRTEFPGDRYIPDVLPCLWEAYEKIGDMESANRINSELQL